MKDVGTTMSIPTAKTAASFLKGCLSCADIIIAEMMDQKRIYNPQLHMISKTLFGPAFVFNVHDSKGVLVRVLCVDGAYQSAMYLGERKNELAFEYYRTFDAAFTAVPDAARVLVIGGGGCAYPRHLLTQTNVPHVDVCEIDPAIADIAQRYFGVDELLAEYGNHRDAHEHDKNGEETHVCEGTAARFALHTMAGEEFLETNNDTFDIIINDAFAGDNAVGSFHGDKTLQTLSKRLSATGVYLINVIDDYETNDAEGTAPIGLSTLTERLMTVFESVIAIPSFDEDFGGRDNYLVMASHNPNLISLYPTCLPLSELFNQGQI